MNSLGGFAARTLVAACMAGLAGPSITADTLIDDLESAGFPVNRLGGSWYVRSGNAGGAVPSIAQQRVSPGAGGTGNAYSATGAMPPLLAFVYGECGTQLEPGGAADVSLALFAAIRFDISTAAGGPYQMRIEDSIHGSQCKNVSLPPIGPAMRTVTLPLACFTGRVYGTFLTTSRAVAWTLEANIGSAPFDLAIDNLRLLQQLPAVLETAEDGDLLNEWTGAWRAYSGTTLAPNQATVSCAASAGGAGGSGHAVAVAGTIPASDGSAQYLGGGVCELEPRGDNAVNLTGFVSLLFDVKSTGGGPYSVQIEDTVGGTGTEKVSFAANSTFATVNIPLSSFSSGSGAADLAKARAIRWSFTNTSVDYAGHPFNLTIDNVRFASAAAVGNWALY